MKTVALRHIAVVTAGQSPLGDVVHPISSGTPGLPFIQGNGEFGPLHPVPRLATERPPKRAEPGAVLLSVRAPVGALNVADACLGIGRGIAAISPKPPHHGPYLLWALRASGEMLRSASTGTTYEAVDAAAIKSLRIPAVAPPIQHAIAHFLDRECGRIDALLAVLASLTDKLTEPALTRFDLLTADVGTTQVGRLYEVQLGKMLDEGKATEGELVPYLRNSNVRWDRFDLSDVKQMTLTTVDRKRYEVRPGDLLACEGRHVGKSAIWEGAIAPIYYQKALHRIRPYSTASNRFLMWCLWLGNKRGDYYADGSGSTIPHLPAEKLRRVRIPAVDRETQDRVTRETDATYSAARRADAAAVRLRVSLIEYRDALITEAVTGQLDVTAVSDQQMDERMHEAIEAPQA